MSCCAHPCMIDLNSRGPLDKFRSKCRIFFCWRSFISRVWLVTRRKIVSLRGQVLQKKNGCNIGVHRFTLSTLWGHFSQLSVTPKTGLLKRLELSQFLCYKDYSHNKILLKIQGIIAQLWIFQLQHSCFVLWT